ncbi:hypothetical protein BN946_scf184938.g38 [Trametes cinnabarina]|uniref:Uncharacterized protein n=1 Tax=Pycnoporus cinnabarinus TaxID=5643 RepID=A0A060S1Y2_PYCCI|nr:hypothetical protein BN946_scf184938.g38 [Trametes cinnabarina]
MDRPCVSPRIYTVPINSPQRHHISSQSPLPDTASRDHLQPRSPSPSPQQQHYEQQHQHQHHQQEHPFHAPPPPQHSNGTPTQHHYLPQQQHAYEDYPRPDSRLSHSRLHPPPSATPGRHTPSANTEEVTPPASPSHKRYKQDNPNGEASASANGHTQQSHPHQLQHQHQHPGHAHPHAHAHSHSHSQLPPPPPPPFPCHVDQRWVSARPVIYDSVLAANIAITDHDVCRLFDG